jgi:hypothetical protein
VKCNKNLPAEKKMGNEIEQKQRNGNDIRKWFPSVRIIEGLVIALGAGLVFALAGNFLLLPKLELKMELQNQNICEAIKEIKNSVQKMGEEIINLKVKDQEHEGEINLLKYHTGLPILKKKGKE